MRGILLFLVCIFIQPKVYAASVNIIKPAHYFTNHDSDIKRLKQYLKLYGTAYIRGVRGSGKTELVKKYLYSEKENYVLVGYFNTSVNLTQQLVEFGKNLNLTLNDDDKIDLENSGIIDSIIGGLEKTEGWILIFDNILYNTKEIDKFKELESQGHIVYISSNNIGKKHQILVDNLSVINTKSLIGKIMTRADKKTINELSEILVNKGSPTALIVDSAYFLENNPHYTVEEYIEKISAKNELVSNYLKLTIESLSQDAQKVLMQIALLNNQGISKNIILRLFSNKLNANETLTELLSTNLLRMINSDRDNPVFALHDIYKDELLKLSDNHEATINELVVIFNSIFPENFKYGTEIYDIFADDKTLASNIEIMLNNIEKYQIAANYSILELRLNALINSFESSFLNQAEEHIKWFKEKFLPQNAQPKTINEHKVYSTFLIHLSSSECFISAKPNVALGHLFYARDLGKIVKDKDLLSYINIDIAQIQAYTGDIGNSRKSLEEATTMIQGTSTAMVKVLFVRSLISLMEGEYQDALQWLEEERSLCYKLGIGNRFETYPAIIGHRARILNEMKRFKEAYDSTYSLYTTGYNSLDKSDVDKADILTQLSRAALGLGNVHEALKYAEEAVNLFLGSKSRNNKNINTSTDIFLAESIVVYGDCLAQDGQPGKALKQYNKAEVIYKNVYNHNFTKLDNISYLSVQAAKVSYKLRNNLMYNHYSGILQKMLPSNHRRIKEIEEYIAEPVH